jgi:transposase
MMSSASTGRTRSRPAYLGLVPRELSSEETQRRGRITKAGSSRVRWLLIQAAVSMLRLHDPRTAALREWAGRIAARRGKGIAVVAHLDSLHAPVSTVSPSHERE